MLSNGWPLRTACPLELTYSCSTHPETLVCTWLTRVSSALTSPTVRIVRASVPLRATLVCRPASLDSSGLDLDGGVAFHAAAGGHLVRVDRHVVHPHRVLHGHGRRDRRVHRVPVVEDPARSRGPGRGRRRRPSSSAAVRFGSIGTSFMPQIGQSPGRSAT